MHGDRFALIFFVIVCCFAPILAEEPTIVGEHVPADFETNHPYTSSGSPTPVLTRTDVVAYPGATYIAIHFATMELAPGDFVVVRSPDHKQFWRYTDTGRQGLGLHPNGFFATHIKGDTAIVELHTANAKPKYGYVIDFFGRGYNDQEIQEFWDAGLGYEMNLPEPREHSRSLCTADDTDEAKCYQTSEPDAYDKGRAVARLLLNGSAWCTGWLIGCDGHIMTNEHCIGSQAQLNDIDFEFMAEGADCSVNCASSLACPGVIEASGGTMIDVDAPLDYALVLPDTSTANGTDLPATYGFMQLRESGPVLDERIYIVQHPAGWGKRIAMESTYPGDVNGFPTVTSVTEPACSGGPVEVGYWADTQGGSSGSPVLAYSDNLVVALHHCRGSAFCASGNPGSDDPNRGVTIDAVIASLGANLPNCATCDPPTIPTGIDATASNPNQIDLSWNAIAGSITYNVYRAVGTCPASGFELIASGVGGTTYSDTTVSGNVTYAYYVTSHDDATGCESDPSTCDSVQATGDCTLPPSFDGAQDAVNGAAATCSITVLWNAGQNFCGSNTVYNIYRDQTSGFTPGAGNLLASCVTGTSYMDEDVESGVTYYYIVRAEDDSGGGAGPCAGGIEEDNTIEVSAIPTGPDTTFLEDDLEGGTADWNPGAGPGDPGGTAPWALVTTDSNSPTHSWFCSDEPTVKDQVVATANAIALPNQAGIRLSFFQRVDTEDPWDGGVLEYSTDGTNWFDILAGNGGAIPINTNRFLANGYVGTLNASANPLANRAAWFGDLGGFQEVIVDMNDFAGQNVWLRWRMGCDASVAAAGWWVDDVKVFFPTDCSFEIPDFTFEMWLNEVLFHPAYDFNGNGMIEVSDIMEQMNLVQ